MSSASSSQRPPAPRTYPQDYIARIRYNNSLPPPIGPPKLLDIPNTAFAQYTDTTFASALARSEPLNIEVDSELGMPLDLVHCPRVFEGDDSLLRPIEPTPQVDPRDRLLLRPAAALGKPIARTASGGSTVSFLRRTEYISAEQSRSSFKSTTSQNLIAIPSNKRTKTRPEDNDPVRILAAVMKGFDVANPNPDEPNAAQQFAAGDKAAQNAERNWKELKHPNKPGVKAVETWPLMPHLDGMSDAGGYMVFKFLSAPTDQGKEGSRDVKIDASVFQPVEHPADEEDETVEKKDQFDFYIPDSTSTANAVKRKFAYDSDADEEEEFRYNYVRRYETKDHRTYASFDQQPEEVALRLHKGDDNLPRGAYFYPILTRYTIRPKMKNKLQFSSTQRDREEEEEPAEALKLKIREVNPEEKRRREVFVARYEGAEAPQQTQQQEEVHDEDEDAPGEEE